jgi:hypothetical protein
LLDALNAGFGTKLPLDEYSVAASQPSQRRRLQQGAAFGGTHGRFAEKLPYCKTSPKDRFLF